MTARPTTMTARPTTLVTKNPDHTCGMGVVPQGGLSRIAWSSAGLVLVTAVLSCLGMGNWCSFSPDIFRYLTIARALAETGHFPPQQMMAPPGFPIIIAPLLLFGDAPFLALRVLLSLCWAVTGVMTYLLHRRELGERLGWIAGLLVAGSPVLLVLTTTPVSESVFVAISTTVLVVMDSWRHRPVRQWWFVAFGGLLTAAACSVRSVGVVLLPIMGLTLLHDRRQSWRRRVVWAVIYASCTLGPWTAWQVRQSIYPAGPSYTTTWTTAIGAERTDATGLLLQFERLSKYGPKRLEAIKEVVLPKQLAWRAYNPPLDTATTWLVGGLFVVTATGRFVRFRSPVDAYVLLTLAMLSLWPWDEGGRFVAPLIPVLVGYPIWVGRVCWRRAAVRWWERCVLAAMLLWLLAIQTGGMGVVQSKLPDRREKAVRRFAAMSTLASWHATNTPAGARWVGVTPNRHNGKLLLLGAAYLSRRPVTTIDLHEGTAVELPSAGTRRVFVHESLIESGSITNLHDYTQVDAVGEFVVFGVTGE